MTVDEIMKLANAGRAHINQAGSGSATEQYALLPPTQQERKMANIKIKMKDGSIRRLNHEGRPGGSYTKTIRYEGAFAVVTDEWGNQTAVPAADIAEVEVDLGKGHY